MTEEQKARVAETRAKNKAARDQRRHEREAQEEKDRALMLTALRGVIVNRNADPLIRMFAVFCLDHACNYHILPRDLKFPGCDSRDDSDGVTARLRAKFAEELKAAESANT